MTPIRFKAWSKVVQEDDFDEESEVIVKVIIDYRIEEVQETKPTFESELAELKKKYNVE